MKRLMMLILALVLISGIAMAGETPYPYCSCELCAADGDQTCESYWTGLLHPCFSYYGTYCSG